MITLVAITIVLAAAFKFGVEDRPGFNERRPLS
jgi:FlaG/FlaF family flagellin (archaellin)